MSSGIVLLSRPAAFRRRSKERARSRLETLREVDVFNYGCAEWGAAGTPPVEIFSRFLEIIETQKLFPVIEDPNFLQCLSLTYFVCGKSVDASQALARAIKAIENMPPQLVFSCWRYLYVKRNDFRQDLEEMAAAMQARNLVPSYMKQLPLLTH
jgi:hypothetical protein